MVQINQLIGAVIESLGEILPTPAGVMVSEVPDKWFRMGLGGRVVSHSNP
ncbi:hypothetical protein [Rhodohalobacter sp. 8-1]